MKQILITCLLFFITINSIGEPKLVKSFSENSYLSSTYIIEDDYSLKIQKIFEFPNYNKEKLLSMVKSYMNNRIEKRSSNTRISNSDIIYNDYAFINSETSPSIKINLVFYTKIHYIYRLEVKDFRIRATIFLSSIDWGNFEDYPFYNFYPFRKIGGGEKALTDFGKYIEDIFTNFHSEILSIYNNKINDDW